VKSGVAQCDHIIILSTLIPRKNLLHKSLKRLVACRRFVQRTYHTGLNRIGIQDEQNVAPGLPKSLSCNLDYLLIWIPHVNTLMKNRINFIVNCNRFTIGSSNGIRVRSIPVLGMEGEEVVDMNEENLILSDIPSLLNRTEFSGSTEKVLLRCLVPSIR
jgi:hypothetical protein